LEQVAGGAWTCKVVNVNPPLSQFGAVTIVGLGSIERESLSTRASAIAPIGAEPDLCQQTPRGNVLRPAFRKDSALFADPRPKTIRTPYHEFESLLLHHARIRGCLTIT
jgi:hypothetical protein